MILFTGNCPVSVKKDAKYHIRLEKKSYVVGISYSTENGEYWTPTTTDHPALVEMVNSAKKEFNAQPGGAFYINEFRQVIVPTLEGYFLVGEYRDVLSFKIKDDAGRDVEISGRALNWDLTPMKPGDEWSGCLMGIPYILTAGGNDIRFEIQLSENHYRKIPLSKATNPMAAKNLARRLCGVIGDEQGGRFYINDMKEMFKPVTRNGFVSYIYLGKLNKNDQWFPKELFEKPHVQKG